MDFYDKLGVRKLINAADSYTYLGGSLIPREVFCTMEEASRFFVSLNELHTKVGEKLAKLTQNESAFVTGGAAAGIAIVTAACITGLDPGKVQRLPDLRGMKNEVILHRCQRNGYDHAIRQIGVNLVEVGSVENTYNWQLESAITENTACIFYFASATFKRGSLPLEEVIEIGKRYSIPIIVDAAAQLPPVENLWKFTQMGADAAVFSGGKSLRGPQGSGFIVGKKSLIDACRLNTSPNQSIGRSMKLGKEEIAGLLAAVERYINLNHSDFSAMLEQMVAEVQQQLNGRNIRVERLYPGPTGQLYPRATVYPGKETQMTATELQKKLAEGNPGIMVDVTYEKDGIIVNPINLEKHELEIVIGRIKDLLNLNG